MSTEIAKSFTTGNADLNGTSLQGYVDVPFSKVVSVFGEPGDCDGYKVAFQWEIVFADGTVAAIYDYKSSSLYDDGNPTPAAMRAAEFSDWHIGGHNKRAVELVHLALA